MIRGATGSREHFYWLSEGEREVRERRGWETRQLKKSD